MRKLLRQFIYWWQNIPPILQEELETGRYKKVWQKDCAGRKQLCLHKK